MFLTSRRNDYDFCSIGNWPSNRGHIHSSLGLSGIQKRPRRIFRGEGGIDMKRGLSVFYEILIELKLINKKLDAMRNGNEQNVKIETNPLDH